jgi:hypothetical protein
MYKGPLSDRMRAAQWAGWWTGRLGRVWAVRFELCPVVAG